MTQKPPVTKLRILEGGARPAPVIPVLETWMATTAWLEGVSDAYLALLLTEHLLLETVPGTLANDLLSEAIDRLEGRSPRQPEASA